MRRFARWTASTPTDSTTPNVEEIANAIQGNTAALLHVADIIARTSTTV
ncbi:hypothetical protein [Streptomyces mirabilis]